MATTAVSDLQSTVAARFTSVRRRSLELCTGLTPEDMMVQSSPDASPAKWHIAHTAWFFESFVLVPFLPGYRLFNPDFPWLFNSYYEGFSAFPEKKLRSSFSRPSIEEILGYRHHVDRGVERLLQSTADSEALRRIELGVNHEEQHQELLLTDIKHAFFTNPLRPFYKQQSPFSVNAAAATPLTFQSHPGGLIEVGHSGEQFCFDNELPRHRVWLEPFQIAQRLITCNEFAAFMADGGYAKPELWLSAGWNAVKANNWRAPLYWTSDKSALGASENGNWSVFTLGGELPLEQLGSSPVSHVSYYEADAYARWAGHRLPTEFEWESAAESQLVEGNLLESGLFTPIQSEYPTKWGDCWVWTSSAYLGYPGFRPLEGALGEYNGKFMSGQMVLRGGSCVTPAAHIRVTYRNFFSPETRWQFSGIRLAS